MTSTKQASCQKIVHPLKKGEIDYQCRRLHYKDGWCKQHHPVLIAEKEKAHKLMQEKHRQSLKDKNSLTIENAIVFLVNNGYRVEKVNAANPNNSTAV